jgi:hypothetical protein
MSGVIKIITLCCSAVLREINSLPKTNRSPTAFDEANYNYNGSNSLV